MEKNPDSIIQILIVDDHPVVRGGLRTMINSEPGMNVIGEACDGQQATDLTIQLNPDLILMDLVMPRKDGISAIEEIIQIIPAARILVLSSFDDEHRVLKATQAGAAGYLLKDSTPEELVVAIREVAAGQNYLPPGVVARLMRAVNAKNPDEDQEKLTERELEVLKLVAKGETNQEIGKVLNISERTVTKHMSSILGKLNFSNRTQAALYAVRLGLGNVK